jgi:hypothetical protein
MHRRTLVLLTALAVVSPSVVSAQAAPDAVLEVRDVRFGTVRLGENRFEIALRNLSETTVIALLDLRAAPGMWLLPPAQQQFSREFAPGEEGVLAGTFEFRRLSPEATLRVALGVGEPRAGGYLGFSRIDFRRVYEVGATSPDAFDPAAYFTIGTFGPLEIYAWRGSLAERVLDTIAAERLAAVAAIEQLLGVAAPERIRLVFYPDEARKLDQTGHQGRGWAWGTTLVEVYSEDVQLDPYHELVHVLANALGSPPPLLNEGLAVYASELLGADALRLLGFPGTPVHRAVCGLGNGTGYISLADLLALDNIGSDAERAPREYAQAASFVKYLVERHGLERFRDAYRALRGDAGHEENLRRIHGVYGLTLDQLEAEWWKEVGEAC